MSITILTSREFDQDISGAMKAAAGGPIFITEGGRPSHVLLTIYDYRRLIDGRMSLAEALAQPHGHFDFDPPRANPGVSGRAWLDQSPAYATGRARWRDTTQLRSNAPMVQPIR